MFRDRFALILAHIIARKCLCYSGCRIKAILNPLQKHQGGVIQQSQISTGATFHFDWEILYLVDIKISLTSY
jgi:hypothetical protein